MWTGLQVQIHLDESTRTPNITMPSLPVLKTIENDIIRRAMQQARAMWPATRRLDLSRATLYGGESPKKGR